MFVTIDMPGRGKFLTLMDQFGVGVDTIDLTQQASSFQFIMQLRDSNDNIHSVPFSVDLGDFESDIILPDAASGQSGPVNLSLGIPLSWFGEQSPAYPIDEDAVNNGNTPAAGKYGYNDHTNSELGQGAIPGSLDTDDYTLKLYECNYVTDPEQSVLDNAYEMVASMGQALLIPSQGRLKLVLNYPTSAAEQETIVTRTLNDSGLSLDGRFSEAHPGLKSRKNEASVDFLNEQLDFKRDTQRLSLIHI